MRDEAGVRNPVLPDLLGPGLRIVFCGTAAGTVSAARGAYYAHPQNRFWSALYAAGLTPRLLQPEEFDQLPQWGLGLTDIAKHVSGMDRELPPGALGPPGLRGAQGQDRGRRAEAGSRLPALPPGADISAAPPASANSPSALAEPASGSCRRPRRPRAGIGTGTSTGGERSRMRRGTERRRPRCHICECQ